MKRFKEPKKVKRIAGLLVLDSGTTANAIGKRIVWYDLRCKCSERFRTTQNSVTLAASGRVTLQCDTCRAKRHVKRQHSYYQRVEKEKRKRDVAERGNSAEVARAVLGKRPPITPEAVKVLAAHAKKPYYRRALQILVKYINACVEARTELHWNRGAIEAVEKAELEYRTGAPANDDNWTRENIHDGLCVVSYSHYAAPRDTGMM